MIQHQQVEKRQHGVFGVIGDLSFESVPLVEKEGFAAISLCKKSDGNLVFDLSGLGHCSSAALALLLSWLRKAHELEVALTFRAVPEQLQALINSAQLGDILPLSK